MLAYHNIESTVLYKSILFHLSYYKKNHLKPKETGLPKFIPVDAGVQLDKKEKIDEDGKPFSSLAATNPLPQETSFCMWQFMYPNKVLLVTIFSTKFCITTGSDNISWTTNYSIC